MAHERTTLSARLCGHLRTGDAARQVSGAAQPAC
jgi:hypothetical protein